MRKRFWNKPCHRRNYRVWLWSTGRDLLRNFRLWWKNTKIIKWKCILTCHLLLNLFSIRPTLHLPKMGPKENKVKKKNNNKIMLVFFLSFASIKCNCYFFIISTWFRRVLRCSQQRFGPWLWPAPGRRSVRRPSNYKFFTTGSGDEEKRIYASLIKISE